MNPDRLLLTDAKCCPKSALGHDFDGARFAHVGDEAPGLEAVVRGLKALHAEDADALLAAALPVYDALHAALAEPR